MSQPDPRHSNDRPDPLSFPQDDVDMRGSASAVQGEDPLDAVAAAWMVRCQDGLTSDQRVEFEQWLASNPAHARALARLEGTWDRLGHLPVGAVDALRAGLPSPAASAADPSRAQRPAPQVPPRRRSWRPAVSRVIPRAAAAAIAFAAMGTAWIAWNAWQRAPIFEQSFATARGEQTRVELPDGSTLWLDTATRADVSLYRTHREVRLSTGQVFFAVHPDREHPFNVLAANTRVTVVGTRFSVRRTGSALDGSSQVSVAVEQGHVRVAKAQDTAEHAAAVDLLAGQSVIVGAGGKPGPVGSEVDTSWREGRISFSGTRLDQALAEFERYGDTGLVIHDPAVAALKVQGSFNLRRAGAFARALPQVLPVRLDARGGHTEIVAVSAE